MNTTMKRVTTALGAIALGAIVTLAGAVPANAVDITNSTPVSLTIHKHEKTATNGTTTGTGKEANASVAGAGIDGVSFSVQRVGSIDLTTDAGWKAAATIRAKVAAGESATQAVSGYTLGTAITGTTATVNGEKGYLKFDQSNGLTKSMYLVTEVSAPSNVTTKADPFLVTLPQADTASDNWIYDVHVYPKNGVSSLTKTVVAPTAAETAAGRDLVRWNINTTVPYLPTTSQATAMTSFVVSDTIDPANLAFVTTPPAGVAASTATLVNAAGTSVALTVGAANTNDVTIAASGATQLKATFNASGLTKLQANQGGTVTFSVLTRVINVPANGQIANTAGTSINGVTNGAFDGVQTGPVISATTPFANLTIFSYAKGTSTTPLGGAVYVLQDASGNPVIVNGSAVTGTADPATGQVTFKNVPAGDYKVAVTTSVPGYTVDGASERSVTVVAGTQVIPSDPKAAGNNYVPVPFTQVPAWALPLTGGDGGLWFGIGGAALIAMAIGAAVIIGGRRRPAAVVATVEA
ncbi:SpaH/EbpB family LPXTG-anchored major pilin [Microbacterium tenebrionis]|uniref:SpaH/EbpB family LPXTG-anchored major pilin n=1 Tax=Microbacterium tenebrionis TaxID=2830665 RepID=UPI001588AEA4|nr:SpaH/EbpB family LPXTG-anchored major pilin [Microbacterium ihumii]